MLEIYIQVISGIEIIKKPNAEDLAERSSSSVSTVKRVISSLREPFPKGFGMKITYSRKTGYVIDDWGELANSVFIHKLKK